MAQIHDLILHHGINAARAQSITKAERVAAEAAYRVMTDEQQRIGIMHAGFAMTALPHRATTEIVWERQSGDVKLLLESGRTSATNSIGLPYGSVARMILLYLQTEAVKTRSRDVELGRSMNTWLTSMGMGNGGHNYSLVREQSRRLSLCRLTFLRVSAKQTFITNGSFVHDAILPNEEIDESQLQFWRPSVRLDEGFYKSLIEHPLPVQEAAIRSLGHRSMAIDIYLWLAYRLHILEKPIKLTWYNLANQFGSGFADIKNFKKKFREPLFLALAAYPDARVEPENGGTRSLSLSASRRTPNRRGYQSPSQPHPRLKTTTAPSVLPATSTGREPLIDRDSLVRAPGDTARSQILAEQHQGTHHSPPSLTLAN